MSGFLMMMTQNGKLLYISDNAAEYLGHSMEDLLIHGDSVYDIIDKQDHHAIQCELGRPVNAGNNTSATSASREEIRLFLCRMNVSRNARRQMRFGDQKVVLIQGRYLSFLPLCSRNEPVFLATCTPIAMPETRECVVQGATNVYTTIHSMDMRFIHIDNNGIYYLGFQRSELQGVSWYRFLHWDSTKEAQSKHRLITQSEQERSCVLLAQFQCRSGDWIWTHCVLQVKESTESNQTSVIVCTNQVLSEAEAAVMRTNSWLYHYYSVQNKLQYGVVPYETTPSPRLLYYPEHSSAVEYTSTHETSTYTQLTPITASAHHLSHMTTHNVPTQVQHVPHHQHHRRTGDSEPVDYSYTKREAKYISSVELNVTVNTGLSASSEDNLLIAARTTTERTSRIMLKTMDPGDLMDQWNPSPPWSDTLQKVPDLCHQDLSPYIESGPPTPGATPGVIGNEVTTATETAFSFDWTPEQHVPTITLMASTSSITPVVVEERTNYWPIGSDHRLFPLQSPPKRNQASQKRSESDDSHSSNTP